MRVERRAAGAFEDFGGVFGRTVFVYLFFEPRRNLAYVFLAHSGIHIEIFAHNVESIRLFEAQMEQ